MRLCKAGPLHIEFVERHPCGIEEFSAERFKGSKENSSLPLV
jgi:hypothetical protein